MNGLCPSTPLLGLWQRQVEKNPDRPAVAFEGKTLTYLELDHQSDQLAHWLLGQGVGASDCVGICLERSLDVPAAVLATLKAGAAYLPLDARYPKDRLAFMLADANVRVLLTNRHLLDVFSFGGKVLCLEEPWVAKEYLTERFAPVAETENSLAYVIYTSGSTGKPKGVAMGRAALANLICWQEGELPSDQPTPPKGEISTRTLQYTPLSFDVHFQELFGTWASGGTLVLVPDEVRLDPALLLPFLEDEKIERLFLPFIALQSLAEAANARGLYPSSLRDIVTAGEQLQITSDVAKLLKHLKNCRLHNHYGPSETHVVTAYTLTGPVESWLALPPIGKPLPGVTLHLFDEQGAPVAEGDAGELFIAGIALAQGYYRNPELTAERFVERDGLRMYRTGDLARRLHDGNYEYLGRLDGQVKIRGHRVELGEIEVALSGHPNVRQAAVAVHDEGPGQKRLVAYLVPREPVPFEVTNLRHFLTERLPEYMVPAAFLTVEQLPRTPSGKVDRRSLPRPQWTRPELAQEYVAPQPGLEQTLANLWRELLNLDRVGTRDPFFEIGGNSLLSVRMLTKLRQETGLDVPLATFFRYPTIAGLTGYLQNGPVVCEGVKARIAPVNRLETGSHSVAIIGMAGRFPGAANVEELWHNLCQGVESVTFFQDEELDPGIPDQQRRDPTYVKARGVLKNAECFDAAFFGITPREAELMDPQQRVFMETAWEALENVGYVPEQFRGSIGVYAGAHNNSYYPMALALRPDLIARLGEFQTMLANEKDYLATRTAYALNLNGPAISLNTACSTSLVAVVEAVHALLGRQCDIALAGGVAVTCPQNSGYLSQEGGMLSPDGHCRPFDAAANGTLFSNGVGIVVLKRLEDAMADGDTIHAVIRGAALNNDGNRKMSFTAPAVDGQAEVIAMAQAQAGVDPATISYVEAHGTGTPLGDPVEIEALTQAFREGTERKQYCAIGSLKSNLGHLVSAAGVAGLIKTAMSLEHEQLPPSLHLKTPNPRINWASSPFYVNDRLTPWPRQETPRRAAVSSFGVGGTNAHVVLEEAPAMPPAPKESSNEQLLVVSARNETALEEATRNLADYLSTAPASLADVSFTLQVGRRAFAQRRFLVARNNAEAAGLLRNPQARPVETFPCDASDPGVIFMFPGQGTQYAGMGRDLYQHENVFRTWFDRCAQTVEGLLGRDLRNVLFAEDERTLDQTRYAQPALFTIGYALAKLWQSWGVEPAAMLGHSVGEFVAACLAGVFSLEDGLRMVVRRAELMQAQPTGGMLSVRLPADKVAAWLDPTCAIASINGPSLCVVSGSEDSLRRIQKLCDRENVVYRRLRTSHAFHSPMMDAVVEPFAQVVRQVKLSRPRIPILSTVTGTWLTEAQATDPAYWSGHLRATVRFADAVAAVLKEPGKVLLEVGPRNTLATLARQQIADRGQATVIASLETSKDGQSERAAMLLAAGRMWLAGAPLHWPGLHEEGRRRVPLPTYPFQRQRYWVELLQSSPHAPREESVTRSVTPTINERVVMTADRKNRIVAELRDMFEESSGVDLRDVAADQTFLELGLDSLFLTQASLMVQRKYGVPVTFRQLMEELPGLGRLAEYLDQRLPPEAVPAKEAVSPAATQSVPGLAGVLKPVVPQSAQGDVLQQTIAQQLDIMARQLELLGGKPLGAPAPEISPAPAATKNGVLHHSPLPSSPKSGNDVAPKPFGASARITLRQEKLTDRQKQALVDITQRYVAKTRKSKERTQRDRAGLADPRVVSGFRPETKELVYPILVDRSAGSKLYDIDGNEYVDLTCGFGSNFFGNGAPFVVEAVTAQLQRGYEIGPQHPLAGAVAEKIRAITGMERVVFCNTGSEAVLGALRLARTATGRNTVALFNGSYHGIVDEVIVRGGKNGRSVPAAAGIPAGAVENILILDYGTPESLKILRERMGDLAAVLVEPVQSRHPDLQPREFLHEVRRLTEAAGTALIFDDVITGFRLHPGGAQAWFDLKADLATYGKVIGGGMPIGVIAGNGRFMNGLDGGPWQYGDASIPEAGVTYFAGTFVRHPLALAAAHAVLTHLEREGMELYEQLNAKTARLVRQLNDWFTEVEAPLKLECCGSLFKVVYTTEVPFGELLHTLLRLHGIHIWDARPCFLTTAHQEADLEKIVLSFQEAVRELQEAGFYPQPTKPAGGPAKSNRADVPPVPGARLGKEPNGEPAWFIPDVQRPGKYVKVGSVS